METRAHHVLIGAFAIGAFLLVLGFVLWMSRSTGEQAFHRYDVVFSEAVTGLSVGGLVQYNGIKVGEVTGLQLARDDPRKVIARVRVDASTPVSQDTRARLGLQGVTGLSFIQLAGGGPDSIPLLPSAAVPVPVIPSEPSALSRLLDSGSDVITSVNDVLLRFDEVLSKQNVDHLAATLENVERFTATLAAQRGDIGKVVDELARATTELRSMLSTVNQMATSTHELMRDDARAVLQSVQATLESVTRLADSTEALLADNRGAIGDFGSQGLPQIAPALIELRQTLRSLQQLSDRLNDSDSLLLGREQPKEFRP